MAIRWNLQPKLDEHGITPYRLSTLTGLSVPSCYDLARGEPVGNVKASTLSALCALFECGPGDLLEYIPDE